MLLFLKRLLRLWDPPSLPGILIAGCTVRTRRWPSTTLRFAVRKRSLCTLPGPEVCMRCSQTWLWISQEDVNGSSCAFKNNRQFRIVNTANHNRPSSTCPGYKLNPSGQPVYQDYCRIHADVNQTCISAHTIDSTYRDPLPPTDIPHLVVDGTPPDKSTLCTWLCRLRLKPKMAYVKCHEHVFSRLLEVTQWRSQREWNTKRMLYLRKRHVKRTAVTVGTWWTLTLGWCFVLVSFIQFQEYDKNTWCVAVNDRSRSIAN